MDKATRDRIKEQAKAKSITPMAQAIANDALATVAGKIIPPKGGSGTAPAKKTPKKVSHVCGHTTNKGKPEEPCGPCKNKAEVEAARAKRASMPPKHKREDHAMEERGRLPNGAVFVAGYDAEKRQWAGSLTIDGFPIFTATKSGVFRLMRTLDIMYRDAVKTREGRP